MRLRLPLSLSVALLSWQNAEAQLAPPEDFFHSGAQFYISNSIPQAKEQVEMGLKLYPNDEKLKKLEQLLNQQNQQQQQSQQNQQQQQNQSQQQKSDSKKDQQKQDQSARQNSQEKQDQAAQKKEEQQKQAEQKKADQAKKDDKKPEDQSAEGEPAKPGQMTPKDAKRLLDAQKGDEQFLQLKPNEKPRDPRRPVKDW